MGAEICRPVASPLLKVLAWPGPRTLSKAAIRADAIPIVLGIATPDTTIRDVPRELARKALREALGILLESVPEEVRLISQPGQPLRLDHPGTHIGLSISHERGLTLAAIHPGGAVGLDLMQVEQRFDWATDWEPVALAYLGVQASERIDRQPPTERARAFALEWTRHEACLKCHGLPLQEWHPALEHTLMRCRYFDLDLPEGYIGTLAATNS